VDEEMKANDDGQSNHVDYIVRHHHTDDKLKAYMYKRQNSNPDLFRWDGVDHENRVAIDPNDYDGGQGSDGGIRQGAEIELMPSAPLGTIYQESRI
jgi:hypothetical protein